LLYVGAMAALFSGGIASYVLAPITSYTFFSDIKFWKHLKHFHKIFLSMLQYIRLAVSSRKSGYRVMVPVFSPPTNSPNPLITKISSSWPYGLDTCGGCFACCEKFGCFLLDENKKCLSYNSIYWRYFNCGRFPEDSKQLEYYKCLKWKVIKDTQR